MQGQRGKIGSFPEPLGFEHGSTSSDVGQSDSLSDYISLNSPSQESPNANMWNVDEPSSSSGPNEVNPGHTEPRPDRMWPSSSSFSDPFGPSSDPFELDDRRLTRKRKAVELNIGQSSSGVGSSDMFQRPDDGSDPIIPRLGLNVNLRINSSSSGTGSGSGQQDLLPGNSNNNRESDISGLYPSLRLNPTTENSSSHTGSGQPVLRIPSLRRNFQTTSRWTRSTASRINRSSSSNLVIPGDRNDSDSIFAPPVGGGGSGGTTTSQAGPSSGPSSSYNSRRLSAFLRRSLLSANDIETGGGQNGNLLPRMVTSSSSSSSLQDVGNPPVVSVHQQPQLRSSLLLGRQLDGGGLGGPRGMTAGSEGRGRLVSEIRNVLDSMRRGEPLRFEDLMLLDQSVFFGIADIHDRHRDMRLDIDNMSYEELLALEERIGNVNTGLTEETILKHLKQKQYLPETGRAAEPCCVCQEDYKEGDDIGTLECGHDFHHGCIKQWLQQKNSCPICKSTGFTNK